MLLSAIALPKNLLFVGRPPHIDMRECGYVGPEVKPLFIGVGGASLSHSGP